MCLSLPKVLSCIQSSKQGVAKGRLSRLVTLLTTKTVERVSSDVELSVQSACGHRATDSLNMPVQRYKYSNTSTVLENYTAPPPYNRCKISFLSVLRF
jgi:hypothetical protein